MPAFKTEPVAAGVHIARGINLAEARTAFGNRMLGPNEVHLFAKSHPQEFSNITCLPPGSPSSIYMGVAVSKPEPLGEFVSNKGIFTVSTDCDGEERLLEIKEAKLVAAAKAIGVEDILKRENSVLLFSGCYSINENDRVHTFVDNTATPEELARYMRFYQGLFEHGRWYIAVEGMPVGRRSGHDNPNALPYCLGASLGSVTRGDDIEGWYGGRLLSIGERFDERFNVLFTADECGARDKTAPAQGRPKR